MARLAFLVLCFAGIALFTAPGASAHAELRGVDPADGASVETLPSRILLGFTEEMSEPSTVEVVGPDGGVIQLGEPIVVGPNILQEVRDPELRGTYEVSYEVTSADDHTLRGTYTFTVTSGDEVEGAGDGSSANRTLIIVMWVVLGGLAVALGLLTRFRRDQT